MIQKRFKAYLACAAVFLATLSLARAQVVTMGGAQSDVWIGSFPDDNVNTPTDWVGGVVPPGYMSGADIFAFNDDSDPNLNI
ncbi:MAG TPA: hypothetical protein VFE25_13545, partial [Opitutaceae bacterium]|nr:hypothetical protein [Opitutaceae bacterium]